MEDLIRRGTACSFEEQFGCQVNCLDSSATSNKISGCLDSSVLFSVGGNGLSA